MEWFGSEWRNWIDIKDCKLWTSCSGAFLHITKRWAENNWREVCCRMASRAVILFNKCVASGSGDNNSIQTSYAFFLQFGFLITSSQQDFHRHASFFEMLEAGPWKVLPGVNTIAEGVRVYWKFYTEEKERSNGVLAICAAKSAAQPYISLATISSLWVFSLLGP